MKVLVTGGAGFIGSHLCLKLAESCDVVAVDDLSAPATDLTARMLVAKGVQFVSGDIRDYQLLKRLMPGVDVVYHLAVIRHPEPLEKIHDVNAGGTLRVLMIAKQCGVRRVVYSSSSSVYGNAPPTRMETLAGVPVIVYGASKLAGEAYCSTFHKPPQMTTISLRYFNVYGERQRSNSAYAAVIPRFIKSLREGKSPEIFGDGFQVRDFTFVDDVVAANILAGSSDVSGVYNIGSGEGYSIHVLLEQLNDIMGTHLDPIYLPARDGDVPRSIAYIEKARQRLGYFPQWRLINGLRRLVKTWTES